MANTPLPRLKLVFKDIVTEIRAAQLTLSASSLAYVTILSIIPLLAVAFSIFQAFGGTEKLYQTIEPLVIENLAEAASEEAMAAIRGFINNIHASAIGVGGLIGLIFTSFSMLSNVENAINRVWKTEIKRSWFHRIAAYWLFLTLGPLAIAVAIGAATSNNFPLTALVPSGVTSFVIAVLLFFGVYKWVPNRKVDWRPALVSATVTALIWNLARQAYMAYTSRVVTYKSIYGSLAAIPILLLWIYILWLIVLCGAAVTVALQRRIDFD